MAVDILGPRPSRRWRLTLALAAAVIGAAHGVDHHGVLGLSGDATALQVHLAFVNLTKGFGPGGRAEAEDTRRLAQIQEAFEALGDAEGKEEVLTGVNYWEHVRRLEDDVDLQRFTELQTNGSAHLRIVFAVEQPGQRRWGVFSAAARLHGRARVAQIAPADAAAGRFFAGFKLRQYPAAVIYDPVSRGMRVAYGVDGVGEDARRLLDGRLSPGDRVARVQELDAPSHALRCGGAHAGGAGEPCEWSLVLATSAALEQRRDGVLTALRPFVDACQRVHTASAPCFWLRLGRANQWEDFVRRHGAGAADDLVLFAVRHSPDGIVVAPPGTANSDTQELTRWLREAVEGKLQMAAAALPPFPQAIAPDEEPAEELSSLVTRKVKKLSSVFQSKLDELLVKGEGAFQKMDTEEKTMLAGVVLCVLMLFGLVCRSCCCCCCCGRRAGRLTEEEAAKQLAPVLAVRLQRGGGEKLGLGIAPNSENGFTITGVAEGTLVDRWNSAQPSPELRVRKGDRIVSVTSYPASSGGQGVFANSPGAIQDALRRGDDVCLAVAVARNEQEVQCLAATVVLEGLTLGEAAELCPPCRSWGGAAKDAPAAEIASVSPALARFNDARRAEGACCLQQLQVGDRVVAVNSALDVRAFLGVTSPSVVVARWRPAATMRPERFTVEIQRSGPEDRLGMQIRPQPGGSGSQLEVLEVVPSGAIARWNSTPGSKPVLKGDRILRVNGLDKNLQQQLVSMKVTIEFERWADDSLGSSSQFHSAAGGTPAFASSPAPPPAAPPSAAPPGSATPKEDRASHSAFFLPWRSLVLALLISFSFLGDQPVLPRVLEALTVLEPLAAGVRGALSAVPGKDQVSMALVLFAVGCLLALWFLWYEVRMLRRPQQRSTVPQLFLALCASTCLGFGNFCLLTWAGVQA